MIENFGNGWVERGPRKAVKGWDGAMRKCKSNAQAQVTSALELAGEVAEGRR
ncbi:hypothetical protein PBI_TOAKA_54 [Mycobacterium phage Toaka]|nr:hypothetical protein PBI_TOAKA_54 [Mycobacterium phage Toaka]